MTNKSSHYLTFYNHFFVNVVIIVATSPNNSNINAISKTNLLGLL